MPPFRKRIVDPMKHKNSDKIDFEILLISPGMEQPPRVNNIEKFRPKVEAIEFCRRWLSSKGVACHSTDFGLACSAPKKLIESVLYTKIEPIHHTPGKPIWRFVKNPKPPSDIAKYIAQIVITAKAELF